MNKVFGTFTKYGYSIWSRSRFGDPLYQGGNCQYDSAQVLTLDGSVGVLDLATIEQHCESTGREIAGEQRATWIGCQHDTDEETEIDLVLQGDGHDN